MNEIKKTTLHPDNQPNTDLYPKTSTDQIEGLSNIITGINNEMEGLNNITTGINNEIKGLNNIITGINNEIEKKVNTVDNFVKVFTIPNGVSSGTLTADVKEKLCNPDGHNYYVYDDTSQMILKYSFNADDEIIQYRAVYLQTNKAYEITMQILPSNGSWRRSQTVLNVPASAGGKLYRHRTTYSYEDSTRGPVYITVITISSTATEYTANSYDSLVNNFVCGYKYSLGNIDYETIIYLDGGVVISTYVTNCISSSGEKSQYVGSKLSNFTDIVTEL